MNGIESNHSCVRHMTREDKVEKDKDAPSWASRVWAILGAVGALIALAVMIYGFNAYVDSRIEQITSTREFLEKVAARVRPSLIFDANESVLQEDYSILIELKC